MQCSKFVHLSLESVVVLRFPRRRSVSAKLWRQPKQNTFLQVFRLIGQKYFESTSIQAMFVYNTCVIMLAENLRLQTVEQVVFPIVGEHTLVVEHPTPSFKLIALSVSYFYLVFLQALSLIKKDPG